MEMEDPSLEQMDIEDDSQMDSDVRIDIKPMNEILEPDEDENENENEELTMDLNPMHFLNFCDDADGDGDGLNNEFPDDENGQEGDFDDEDDQDIDGCDDNDDDEDYEPTNQKVEVLIPSSGLDVAAYSTTNLNESVLEKLQESEEESSDESFTPSPSESDDSEPDPDSNSDSEPEFARDPKSATLILDQLPINFPINSFSDGTFDLNHRVFSAYICRERKTLEKSKKVKRLHHLAMRKRKKYNGYFCYFCQEQFRNVNELGLHELTHQKNEFICYFCKMKFISRDILKKHYLKHGSSKSSYFRCLRCSFRGSREKVQNHYQNKDCIKPKEMTTSTRRVRFSCTFCPITYPTIGERDDHQKTHFKVEYNCAVCNRNFSTPVILAMHISRAHNEKPATVEQGENLYGCPFCFEKFTLEMDCETHQNSHFSKEYFCMICDGNKKFSTEFALRSHLNREHNTGANADADLQVHINNSKICHFCSIDFHTEKNCQVHKKLHFENVKIGEIACAICKTAKFRHKRLLQDHAKKCLMSAGQNFPAKTVHTSKAKDNNTSLLRKSVIPTSNSNNKVTTYQFKPANSTPTPNTTTSVLVQTGFNQTPIVKQITRQIVKYEANCPVCGIGLFNVSWLPSHLKLVHKLSDDQISLKIGDKSLDFACQMCPFLVKFKSQVQLDQHFRDHHDSNKTDFVSIVSQIALKPTIEELKCKMCFQDFQNESGLRSHMIHVHSRGGAMYTNHKDPQVQTQNQKKIIIVKKSQLEQYKKSNSVQAAPAQATSTRIVEKLTNDNRYDINVLNVGFCPMCKNSYSNIDYHNVVTHNVEKNQDNDKDQDKDPLADSNEESDEFRCKICFIDFVNSTLMQDHISRVHNMGKTLSNPKKNEKVGKNGSYIASKIDSKAKNDPVLANKIDSKAENDQVFICDEGKCRRKKFYTQKLFEQHVKFIHKVANSPLKLVKKPEPVETETCRSTRSSRTSTRSSGGKRWICGICFINFVSEAKLHEHEKKSHQDQDEEENEDQEEIEFKCKFCPKKSFLTESLFLQHMKWIHKK